METQEIPKNYIKRVLSRFGAQALILFGIFLGFIINAILFSFIVNLKETPPGLISTIVISRVILSFLGIGVFGVGITRSTEAFVKMRECQGTSEPEAHKATMFWDLFTGFGLGMTLYYQVFAVNLP